MTTMSNLVGRIRPNIYEFLWSHFLVSFPMSKILHSSRQMQFFMAINIISIYVFNSDYIQLKLQVVFISARHTNSSDFLTFSD